MTQVSTSHHLTTIRDFPAGGLRDGPDQQRDHSDGLWDDPNEAWDLSWIKSYVGGKHREYYRTATTR
jgi:hypothetical protein